MALIGGLARKRVAAVSGIGFPTLSRWIQQDRRNPEKPTVQSGLEREIAELRKENRMLRVKRDVLWSRLLDDHGQKMTAAAKAMADRKTLVC